MDSVTDAVYELAEVAQRAHDKAAALEAENKRLRDALEKIYVLATEAPPGGYGGLRGPVQTLTQLALGDPDVGS